MGDKGAGGRRGRWGRSQAEAGRFAATGRAKGCIVSAHGGEAEARAFFLCVAELSPEDGRAQTSAYELVGRMVALLSMFQTRLVWWGYAGSSSLIAGQPSYFVRTSRCIVGTVGFNT